MSQSELASALTISPSAVGMYEQGRREPPVEVLSSLADIFQVSIDYLVTGQTQNKREQERIGGVWMERVAAADRRLAGRPLRPFSRQELAVLFAAMLMEP